MDNILDELINAKRIGLSGHIRPDGDCTGACMGMYFYLKNALPEDTEIDVILSDVPESLECIGGLDVIRQYPSRRAYDVFLVLDCGSDRTGNALAGVEKAKKVINIDHHVSNSGTGDVNYIVSSAAATCEILYGLMDKQYIDVNVARALYVGIINDTGVMQYTNTSPHTMRVAANLMEYGFDFSEIISKSFYEKTYMQNKLLGRALSESRLYFEGKFIMSCIDRETMKTMGVTPKDMDGIVSQLRNTAGVEVACYMYELEPGSWKVSLRSGKYVDVAAIAVRLGGGGHVRASGCTVSGSLQEATDTLLEYVQDSI